MQTEFVLVTKLTKCLSSKWFHVHVHELVERSDEQLRISVSNSTAT